jgi:hypothetical protein
MKNSLSQINCRNQYDWSQEQLIFSFTVFFDYNIPLNCSYIEDSKPILLSDIYLRFVVLILF